MIKSFSYSAEEMGPRLLIFGAVHGNEVCGPLAIQRVLAELDSGALVLKRGQVEFVPVCNPRAYALGQRSIERNLNRYFLPSPEPVAYEAKLTNILCPKIASADYFIDLHSTTAGGIPFACLEGNDNEENKLAAAIGAEVLLFGWDDAYAASGSAASDPHESVGTTACARSNGAKAVLLECGQHKDPVSAEVAYRAIHNAIRHIGLVDIEALPSTKPVAIRTTRVVYRGEGGSFCANWGNFSEVKAGQPVAIMPDGSTLTAPADGFIILPHADTPPGTEWFYFGVRA